MNKNLKLILICAGVLLLEVAVLRRFSGFLALSLIPSFILYLGLKYQKEEALIAGFLTGFVFDVLVISRLPLMAVFAVFELLVIFYFGSRHFNLNSTFSAAIMAASMSSLLVLLQILVFEGQLMASSVIMPLVSNIVLSSGLVWLYGIYRRSQRLR